MITPQTGQGWRYYDQAGYKGDGTLFTIIGIAENNIGLPQVVFVRSETNAYEPPMFSEPLEIFLMRLVDHPIDGASNHTYTGPRWLLVAAPGFDKRCPYLNPAFIRDIQRGMPPSPAKRPICDDCPTIESCRESAMPCKHYASYCGEGPPPSPGKPPHFLNCQCEECKKQHNKQKFILCDIYTSSNECNKRGHCMSPARNG